ncbi:MAG: cupin domain-containing protein [Acidobacteriota bacterium]|nr:cupin domain-containing protein [Acidobacteriota bacterium]
MQFMTILALILAVGQAATPRPQPQRRSVGNAAFAIVVTDPSGAPLGDVKVTMTGPVSRDARTERGRIAFENLPSGNYVLRFEREGFFSLEREVVARGGAPIDVKVILTPEPPPPPPPVPVIPPKPPAPAVTGEPVAIDMTSFIEKNYVGRGAGKTSPLACAAGGAATLIQVKDPLIEHTHADADEFLYTVAGEGSVRAAGRDQPLHAGMFMMLPRGVPHIIVAVTRSPLVLLSIKAGDHCSAP